jgi:hypothetical protein
VVEVVETLIKTDKMVALVVVVELMVLAVLEPLIKDMPVEQILVWVRHFQQTVEVVLVQLVATEVGQPQEMVATELHLLSQAPL